MKTENPPQPASGIQFAWKLLLITAARFVLNTARRFAYPFAPILSRGLGVPLTAVTSLIAVNQATTILGVFIGPFIDRCGYRRMMLSGLGALTFGMGLASLFPSYLSVLSALLLAGLGKTIFDPAIQAYVSERVPFERRGLVIGSLEFAWAGSSLFGIPLIALLLERFGWRSPFFVLSVAGALSLFSLYFLMPQETSHQRRSSFSANFLRASDRLIKNRVALGALGFGFCFSLANDNLFVIYGAWLEQSFNARILAIGMGTTVIGLAELFGELLTATLSDKFGLVRVVFSGLCLSIVAYALLPFFTQTFALALTGLFFVFLFVEFTIVSFLSLCTEILPDARATMLSGYFAAAGAGRIVGALCGGVTWLWGGIVAISLFSALICCCALASLSWGLKKWRQSDRAE